VTRLSGLGRNSLQLISRQDNVGVNDMLGARAIVIGSGIAGLSAAAALVDHFGEVVVLERDRAVLRALPRPGVPQGRQPHLLLCGGAAAFRQLFPDFDTDMIACGGIPYSPSGDLRSEIPGFTVLPPREFGLRSIAAPRPLLESVLATRLIAHPNVVLKSHVRASRIGTNVDGMVTGVESVGHNGGFGFEHADLVIDASGQGALTIACLGECGRAPPSIETVGIDIGYSSAVVSFSALDPGFVGIVTHPARGSSRMGYMIRISPDEWHVLLVGRGADQPPADTSSFVDFAESLGTPTIAGLLRQATGSDRAARFHFPANIRRRFTAASEPPAGLLPIGDTLCRFNPIYGQGMTVAAQEAVLLGSLLRRQTADAGWQRRLTRQHLAGCDALIDPAWSFSVIPDFAFPETTGTRPHDLQDRLDQRATTLRQAVDDADVHRAFIEALHLLHPGEAASLGSASLLAAY
jgi:2-polyprenyl-6-methoxyphenol hydroxylase-like FAD-dependent oxidoreductase